MPVEATEIRGINDQIDELELYMQKYQEVDCPLKHIFTPGLYTRTIFMPRGSLITSLIHKTEHQFIVSQGTVLVKVNDNEWDEIVAPYLGITKPGTRRILYVKSDVVWTTVHPIDIKPDNDSEEAIADAVLKIENVLIERHVNKLLGGVIKNNVITKTLS